MWIRYTNSKEEELGVAVISVGNLVVGGSGKTPVVTALAAHFNQTAVVLRGYGRKSQGLIIVSDAKNILCDVNSSGDEAMIYAKKLKNTVVIVSEDRKKGILKAKSLGAKVVFLDDAYSKHTIKKLDFLINVETDNRHCLPSGPYREQLYNSKKVLQLQDKIDFKRSVSFLNVQKKVVLVTSIARPNRLDSYLTDLTSDVVEKVYFPDHHYFEKEILEKILKSSGADALLMTYKDYVKVESFNLPVTLMDLDVVLSSYILQSVENYMKNY